MGFSVSNAAAILFDQPVNTSVVAKIQVYQIVSRRRFRLAVPFFIPHFSLRRSFLPKVAQGVSRELKPLEGSETRSDKVASVWEIS